MPLIFLQVAMAADQLTLELTARAKELFLAAVVVVVFTDQVPFLNPAESAFSVVTVVRLLLRKQQMVLSLVVAVAQQRIQTQETAATALFG
jgi:hypothetical protein